MIDVRSLSKSYGAVRAVDDVSFTVAKGEVVGLLGPNGAGKTTTMRLLTGFISPDSGTAQVAGHDVERDSLAVRRAIGYLPESAPVYLDMLVFNYLEHIARIRAIAARDRLARIHRMADVCGLLDVLHREIGELSKGYRQRVGLAQALIHDPSILILDEPTSGLDPNQIVEIRDLIRSIGRERTVILSSHILPEVEATCDRVIIIDRGHVVASGTPRELAAGATAGNYWLVTIRAGDDDVEPVLAPIDGVRGVTTLDSVDGLTRVRVDADASDALGEAIFARVAAAGWSLAELRRETASLESVFRELTITSSDAVDDAREHDAPGANREGER